MLIKSRHLIKRGLIRGHALKEGANYRLGLNKEGAN